MRKLNKRAYEKTDMQMPVSTYVRTFVYMLITIARLFF